MSKLMLMYKQMADGSLSYVKNISFLLTYEINYDFDQIS